MISFQKVSKRYPGGQTALVDVSFEIGAGEMAFLTGHSGAGKSTLLSLIAAIERPTGGTVVVGGQNVGAMSARAVPFLRRKLGLVFQDQKLLHDRTALENVLLPLAICGFSPKESVGRARAALDKVGLGGREKSLPVALAGGEQQRLCIARAVVNRPTILLADEPTANLDQANANEIIDIFYAFHQVGATVLISTHDERLIAHLANRGTQAPRVIRLTAGTLADGRVAA